MPSATYYVLIDSSESYFHTKGSDDSHTLNAVRSSQQIVDMLQPLDRFALAEIQSCSFSDAAELIDLLLPDTDRDLYAERGPLRERLRQIESTIQPTSNTDIKGAFLGATLAMQGSPAARRFLIIFSDLDEDRLASCAEPIDHEIDLTGIDVLFVEVKRLVKDELNPGGYLERRRFWVEWALAHDARTADILNDAGALRTRLEELRQQNATSPEEPPPQRAPQAINTEPPPLPSSPSPTARERTPAIITPAPPTIPPQETAPLNQPTRPEPPPSASPQPGPSAPPRPRPSAATTAPEQPPPAPARTVAAPPATPPPSPRITRPAWATRPTSVQMAMQYPGSALDDSVSGTVELDCLVVANGQLSCIIVSENPPGHGFGRAALNIAALHRMAEWDGDNIRTLGRRYTMRIPFRVSPG